VQVTAEEELERLLPKRVAVVEVTLADGTHLSERNDTVRGTPEHPISKDEIVAKAIDLITPVLGAETCTNLIEKVFGLEQMKDVREPRPLLQRIRSGKAVEPGWWGLIFPHGIYSLAMVARWRTPLISRLVCL